MDATFALEVFDKAPYVTVSMTRPDGSFTLQFKSATAVGKAEIVADREEKIAGLRAICQRFLPHHMDAFDDAIARSIERTAVVRITLTEAPVGKRKQYDKEGEELKYGRMITPLWPTGS